MLENQVAIDMNYIGLLTNAQKQAGYFVSQDEDFVWLWKSKPYVDIVAVFLYHNCTIRQVREACEGDMNG